LEKNSKKIAKLVEFTLKKPIISKFKKKICQEMFFVPNKNIVVWMIGTLNYHSSLGN
jgi:hypothetical protein